MNSVLCMYYNVSLSGTRKQNELFSSFKVLLISHPCPQYFHFVQLDVWHLFALVEEMREFSSLKLRSLGLAEESKCDTFDVLAEAVERTDQILH